MAARQKRRRTGLSGRITMRGAYHQTRGAKFSGRPACNRPASARHGDCPSERVAVGRSPCSLDALLPCLMPRSRPARASRKDPQTTPLSHVLLYALDEKLTGTIEFSLPAARGDLLFIEGRPQGAHHAVDYYLSRALVDLGFITKSAATLLRACCSARAARQSLIARRSSRRTS